MNIFQRGRWCRTCLRILIYGPPLWKFFAFEPKRNIVAEMDQMDITSAYSQDLSSVLRLTTWERNLKVNRQTAEPRNKPVQCSEHEHRLWCEIIIIHQCQTMGQKLSSSEAF